jgi:hypothetical protein
MDSHRIMELMKRPASPRIPAAGACAGAMGQGREGPSRPVESRVHGRKGRHRGPAQAVGLAAADAPRPRASPTALTR